MYRVWIVPIAAATVLWGCVPLDQYGALREAYNRLDNERTANLAAVEKARKEQAKAADEVKRLQESIKELEARLQKANQDIAALTAQLEAAKNAATASSATQTTPVKEAKPDKPSKKKKKP